MQTPETSLQPRHQQENEQRGARGDGAEGCQQAEPPKPHEASGPTSRVRRQGSDRGGDTPKATRLERVRFCETWRPGRWAACLPEAGVPRLAEEGVRVATGPGIHPSVLRTQ